MKPFTARIILGVFSLFMLVTFPTAESLVVEKLVVRDQRPYLNCQDSSLESFFYALILFVGIFWTVTSTIGLIIFFLPNRKAFKRCSLFWFIVFFITAILTVVGFVYIYRIPHSYNDLILEDLLAMEDCHNCCFYTDKEERIKYGKSFIDYKVFANCPLIDQANPNIDWSKCEGSGDDMLCYASDVGIISDISICKSDSDFVPYLVCVLVMFLYNIFALIYAILFIVMFNLTKPKHELNGYIHLEKLQQ